MSALTSFVDKTPTNQLTMHLIGAFPIWVIFASRIKRSTR